MRYVKCPVCEHIFATHGGSCPRCPNCGFTECGTFEEVKPENI